MSSLLPRRAVLAAPLAALARPALAQDYPARTITFIVGYAPGGASDIIARSIGDEITKATGRSVVVDYRPGGGGGIAGDMVARARPDGYTLLAVSNTFYSVIPFLGTPCATTRWRTSPPWASRATASWPSW
jgi:tripartite-type tricarboxylate transporter receptor subunit TctC